MTTTNRKKTTKKKTRSKRIAKAKLDALANHLAAEMGIETLETRHRDCLDFHEVHVAALKRVIQRAFVLGAMARKNDSWNILNWIDA